jgi:hypothetical protein
MIAVIAYSLAAPSTMGWRLAQYVLLSAAIFVICHMEHRLSVPLVPQMLTRNTPVTQLLCDFKVPSRGGREITFGDIATHHNGLVLRRCTSPFDRGAIAHPSRYLDSSRRQTASN